jgi:hypothetical protein
MSDLFHSSRRPCLVCQHHVATGLSLEVNTDVSLDELQRGSISTLYSIAALLIPGSPTLRHVGVILRKLTNRLTA